MEHSCYRCGASVAEGKPFCPECQAPLIRVALAEAVAYPIPAPDLDLPQTAPVGSASGPANPQSIDWSHALPAVTLAGVIAAALMIFPLGAFGLGMLTSGALAVFFYHRRAPNSHLTSWIGIQLGALSGLVGFAIFTVFVAVVISLSGTQRLRAIALQAINQSAARTSDPQAQQVFDYFKTPSGLALFVVIGLSFLFLIFLVFSAAGGVLGAAWIRRRGRT